MYNLAPDEKTTTVMVYSRSKLIHGELVTKKDVRVSIWPRMQDTGNYIHFLNAELLLLGGVPPKSLKYTEYFFPATRIIGYHLAPPASEPLDYDPEVANRGNVDVELILGAFMLKGKVRVSMQLGLGENLEMSHMTWLSVYDADISNPFLPNMPTIHVPMLLVSPAQVSFGIQVDGARP